MLRIPQRSAMLVATGLIGGALVAAGVAFAGAAVAGSTPSPSPSTDSSTSPEATPRPDQEGRKGTQDREKRSGPRGLGGFGLGFGMLAGRALHGEVVVEQEDGSGTEVLLGQRGTVTATTGTSLTVRSSDGFTVTWTVNDDTRIHSATTDGQPGDGLADVAKGDEVAVGGQKTAQGGTAAVVVEPGVRKAGTWMHRGPGGARGGDLPPGYLPSRPGEPAPSSTQA